MTARHIPVLLDEVVAAIDPRPGDRVIDGTYGAGGYSRAVLDKGADVIGFDRDPDAIRNGEVHPQLRLVHDDFSNLDSEGPADGRDARYRRLVDAARSGGARFLVPSRRSARHAHGAGGRERGGLRQHGRRRRHRRCHLTAMARKPSRAASPAPSSPRARSKRRCNWRISSARRSAKNLAPRKTPRPRPFQGLRIHINRELDELEQGLEAAERALKPGGRLAVVTFHSLEDRIVKSFLRRRSGGAPAASRHLPERSDGPPPSFEAVGKAVRAGVAEQERNPRARSATLRSARRTAAPAWGSVAGEMR